MLQDGAPLSQILGLAVCLTAKFSLKNGFSWVNRILTSSIDTVIILELVNGDNVYISSYAN